MTKNQIKIRAILVYGVYILALGLIQVTLPPQTAILGSIPDLTLILAVLCGYMFGTQDGMIVGLAAGFFRDMLAGRALGLGMLLLMYGAMLSSIMFRRFFRRNILLGLVQIFLITAFYEIILNILTYIVPMLPDVTPTLSELLHLMVLQLPGKILTNIAAGIPMIFLLYFLGPYQRGSRKDDSEDSIVGDSVWRVN